MPAEKIVGSEYQPNVPIRIGTILGLCVNRINFSTFLMLALMLCVAGCMQTTKATNISSNVYKEQPAKKPADKKINLKVTYATSHMFKIEFADNLRKEAQKAAEKHCGTVGTSTDKWKSVSKHGKVAVHKKTVCYSGVCNSIYHCEK